MKALDIDCGMSIEEMEEVTHELVERNKATIEPYDDLMWNNDVSRGIAKPFERGPYDSYEPDGVRHVHPVGTLPGGGARRVGRTASRSSYLPPGTSPPATWIRR